MKSFYSNDYLIEVNEKRCAEYLAASQQFSSKFTVMVVIYSAMSASLWSICRDVLTAGFKNNFMLWTFLLFALCYGLSILFTFLLLIPDEKIAIEGPAYYSNVLKKFLEKAVPKHQIPLSTVIDKELSSYYLADIERVAAEFHSQMEWKRLCYTRSFFFTAIAFALYFICLAIRFFM
ncbi:hypothetical protein CLV59_1011009 [Chitinophaga dinghuensis]|uniref:Uncharacterized protein n=1 Tax=Chitinophaga dinghuensis TaxID=1539050 RepID=A0A327WF89_9BACT|nr:hypothetical protein [Chitinophaga dinghuensis]RAJ88241.1 hypothetical protein CLV59_1011009 [Chitinophaga dinghuensis]